MSMAPSEADLTGLDAEVARLRSAGLLGRPGQLSRLFDFLAERTGAGTPPKESEIAVEVFGRSGNFIAGEDAVVRVYVHRLRKKLDDFYIGEANMAGKRLVIPRGEYRLLLQPNVRPGREDRPSWAWRLFGASPRITTSIIFGAGLVFAGLGGWVAASVADRASSARGAEFLQSGVWNGLARSPRPLLVVLGDYYIHGELDDSGNVERLVREFAVNSRDDLYQRMLVADEAQPDVMDLGLTYLPTSSATALFRVAPLLTSGREVRVMTASSVTPQMMNDNDLLYIGLLSGMGGLLEPAFRGSRVVLGETFDELRVRDGDARFIGGGTNPSESRQIILDYGYFSSFPGPTGNRIMVLAGMRDVGLEGLATAMVDAKVLRSLPSVGSDEALELIFGTEGSDGVILTPTLVLKEYHDGRRLWTTGGRPASPAPRPPS